jgi:hypothetical protein
MTHPGTRARNREPGLMRPPMDAEQASPQEHERFA